MSWLAPWRRRPRASDIEEELRAHLVFAAEDRLVEGETPEIARRTARDELGHIPLLREDIWAVWGWPWLEGVWKDVRLAVRSLCRQPGFTVIALTTLAIGIGINTAVFSLVSAVLIRPLSVPNGDRIVRFAVVTPYGLQSQASLPLAGIFLRQTGVFRDVSAHRLDVANLTGVSDPEQIAVGRVTKDFFHLFGATAVVGRTFSSDEDRPGGASVAVLSHELWVRRFAGRPDVVGATITLGRQPYVIVGVLGAGFDSEQFAQPPDVWVPFQLNPNSRDVGGEYCFVNAALNSDATIESANAQLASALAEIQRARPSSDSQPFSLAVQPVKEAIVSNSVRSSLRALEMAVGFVLLIACANVANLLLVRGIGRAREMAVRTAIGAGRIRLLRQLMTESAVLALAGTACGVGLALATIHLVFATYPGRNPTVLGSDGTGIPRIGEHAAAVTLDWRVLVFLAILSVAVTIVAGLFPALYTSKTDLQTSLKQTMGAGGRERQRRTRAVLVTGEVVLAFVLLIAAGLLIRSSSALRAVQPGFDPDHVLTMRMSVSGTPFEKRDGIERLTREGIHRVLAIPGVQSASTVCCMPLETVWQLPFVVQGRPLKGPFHAFAGWTFVSPGYFNVFRIPVLRGRDFTDQDNASASGVVIINQEMARLFWPTGDALGDRLVIGRAVRPDYNDDPVRQIIGIVGDVRDQDLTLKPRPAMYVPIAQVPDGVTVLNVRLLPIVWLARTAGEPHTVVSAVQEQLQTASGGLPVARVRSMSEVVSESTARRRFDTLLMTVFAAGALSLAVLGVYGLTTYSVAQRTHEMGIRAALGARPRDIRRLIVRQGMTPVVVGVVVGVVAAWGLARFLASMVFAVGLHDPLTFIGAVVLFVVIAWFAAWRPALRATSVSPITALRYE